MRVRRNRQQAISARLRDVDGCQRATSVRGQQQSRLNSLSGTEEVPKSPLDQRPQCNDSVSTATLGVGPPKAMLGCSHKCHVLAIRSAAACRARWVDPSEAGLMC
jgi:hypothetical protein